MISFTSHHSHAAGPYHGRLPAQFSKKQNVVNAAILGLGVLLGMVLSLSSVAFAQTSVHAAITIETAEAGPAHQMTFDAAYNSLSAYVDEQVVVTAWLTYVPDNREIAILRAKKAPQYQSLFAMNLQSFDQQSADVMAASAAQPDDQSLFVRVTRMPGRSRAWMVRHCADGCQVRVAGPVVRTHEGSITLDVKKVSPLEN